MPFWTGMKRNQERILLLFLLVATLGVFLPASVVRAQSPTSSPTHPYLFLDSLGVEDLRFRVQTDPRLNQLWQRFKIERVDSSFTVVVAPGPIDDVNLGRAYGDALGDLTIGYIVLQDTGYAQKAVQIMQDLAGKDDWGPPLTGGHISIGFAFAWDVLYQQIPDALKPVFMEAVQRNGDNDVPNDVYGNINWTASTGEGLLGLAFRHDGNGNFRSFAEGLFQDAKFNYKEKDRSVLWGHGSDGFPHQGLGYWRKYIHVGLFLHAVRRAEPENDWFHLGKEFPGSEFLSKTGYPRIYADIQHPDLATLTWADSRQVRTKPDLGPYGNIGLLSLVASEYKDGYVLDFIDYLINERQARFDAEDWATFLWLDDSGIVPQSYRSLPLSRYWPDMEAAIFRSGWEREDMVFFMRSGSPGGHGRQLKILSPGGHDHPDANGFVLMFDNNYLAAEDGAFPLIGPDEGRDKITYGHNTILIDGVGQKGENTLRVQSTEANMDYLDTPHVGYLLGDATNAYDGIDRFYRYVIYKKHKYFIMVDELNDAGNPHKYEYLLGTDPRHFITAVAENEFVVSPKAGSAKLPVVFVEPRDITHTINTDRPYAIDVSEVDLLRVAPAEDASQAIFFSMLYPHRLIDNPPVFTRIYDDSQGLSGIRVDSTEVYLFNLSNELYQFGQLQTDARLSYFKENLFDFEFLAAGSREFNYAGKIAIQSSQPIVASFDGTIGKIRIGKNLGGGARTTITLTYPGVQDILVDGATVLPVSRAENKITFELEPKSFKIGPTGTEQTVTGNYDVEVLAGPPLDLLAPNGGELLGVDSSFTIVWESNGLFDKVRLEYSSDGGTNWKTIADTLDNSGAYPWRVPDDRSNKVVLRITNAFASMPSDESEAAFTIDKPPVLLSFSPERGPIGTQVQVRGENLRFVEEVRFGAETAEFAVLSDSILSATVPAGFSEDAIFARNQLGESGSASVFVVISAPFIAGFEPSSGPVGTEVAITGLNFVAITEVSFGGVPATTFSVVAETLVTALVPEGATTGVLKVENSLGEATSTDVFIVRHPPTLTAFSPQQGPVGTSLEVSGRDFWEVQSVSLGDLAVEEFEVLNDTTVLVTVPEGAASGKITIRTTIGQVTSTGTFIVTFPPVVHSFAPPSGPPGTQVSIVGEYFLGATAVRFGDGQAQYFRVESDSLITATVPLDGTPGRIAVTGAGETRFSPGAFIVYQPVRTTIFQPVEDTYVSFAAMSSNFGSDASLRIAQGVSSAYLKFDVSSLSGEISFAQIRLFSQEESNQGGAIFSVSNALSGSTDSWSEENLTAINAPAISGTNLDSLGQISANSWIIFDVTKGIAGVGLHSFAIRSGSADVAVYSSKEGTSIPQLVVTTLLQPNLTPTIVSFTPRTGRPGDEITITGTRLNEVESVRLNGVPVPDFSADSFTQMRVLVPEAASSGFFSVENFAGSAISPSEFEVLSEREEQTLTFIPVADSYVRSSDGSRNFGSFQELAVSSSKFFHTVTYLKFNVEGIGLVPSSARLRLYVTDVSSNAGLIFKVNNNFNGTSEPWTEDTITWDNAPTVTGTPVSSTNATQPGWVEFDLLGAVLENGIYSFAIQNRSPDKVLYASRETEEAPQLVIETAAEPFRGVPNTGLDNDATPESAVLPQEVGITANYPNPFNLETTIEYTLPQTTRVRLVVFNLLGQTVKILVDEVTEAGVKKAMWNGTDNEGKEVGSGIYFIQLQADGRRVLRKITLQK